MLTIDDLDVLGNHVLVEPLGQPEKVGRFYLPDSSVGTDQSRGLVHKVGDGETLPSGTVRQLGVDAGDLVFYSKYAGFPMSVGDREYMLIPEHTIAMRVKDAMGARLVIGDPAFVVRAGNGKLYLADEQPPEVDEDGQPLPAPAPTEPPVATGLVLPNRFAR